MARNLIFSVCLGLLVVSVAVANRFQPPGRAKVNSRQAFVGWIRPRPRPGVGGGIGAPGGTSNRYFKTNKGYVTLYKDPNVISSQQIEAFFQRNPAARQQSESIKARSAAFARRHSAPATCSCTQQTCKHESGTFQAYVKGNNDICVVISPLFGFNLNFIQCTDETYEASCPEVLACGQGTCQDVDESTVPIGAICLSVSPNNSLNFYFESSNVILPNGCCCTQV